MAIEWGEAVRIGLVGFGWVFMVLVVLAGAIWLSGYIVRKIEKPKEETATTNTKSGEGE
ncbi:MAG: OadG family protein [Dehalococcoidales bacterium]|nr:MAG: OadG family protein [Dehalococcoidales bacterium]